MRLLRLSVAGFGRLAGCDVAFAPGVNVVLGLNEAGKTTMQQALIAALYGLYQGDGGHALREGDTRWQRFKPWDGPPFAVALEVELDDGRRFAVSRDFAERRAMRTVIVDLDTGRPATIEYPRGRYGRVGFAETHLGLDAPAFQGSASVAQGDLTLGGAAAGLAEELARVVASAGNASADAAIAHVQEALRQIGTGPGARVTPYARLRAQGQALETERDQGIARRAAYGDAVERRREAQCALEQATGRLDVVGDALQRRQHEALRRLVGERRVRELALGLATVRGGPPHLRERGAELQRLANEEERARAALEAAQELAGATREQYAPAGGRGSATRRLPTVVAALACTAVLAALRVPLPLAALAGLIAGLAVLVAGWLGGGWTSRGASGPPAAAPPARAARAAEHLTSAEDDVRRVLEQVAHELAAWTAAGDDGTAEPEETAALSDEALDRTIKEEATAVAQLREEVARLDGSLGVVLGELREQAEVEEELERTRVALAQLDERHAALQLAMTELRAAQEAVHRDFAPRLAALVAPPFHRLTDARYERLFVDPAGLAVRVQPAGRAEPIGLEQLSRGTHDQAFLLLRLAVLALLTEGRESVPLFLDEPFAHCDGERRRALMRTLTEAPFVPQMVLFTCDERLAGELGAGAAVHRLGAGAVQSVCYERT